MATEERASPPPLVLSGEIDLATANDIRRWAAAHIEALDGSGGSIELDLGAVTFIDSTGLGALVALRRAAARAGGRLRLVNVPPAVVRLLELSGMRDWLET